MRSRVVLLSVLAAIALAPAASVTISQTPIEEDRPEWEQLKSEQMRNMAAISFIERSQRQQKAQE
jgi:hypothetical protein